MSAFDPKRTLEEECCNGKNERRELDGGIGRGAISADEISQFVGRRVKRGSGDRDERVPAKPSPHSFANIPAFSQR